MTIGFRHRGVDYRLEEGDPVLVHVVLEQCRGLRGPERQAREPFIGEVEALATPGRWFYVRARQRSWRVPFDGFTLPPGFGSPP